jgi:hypothetical protein
MINARPGSPDYIGEDLWSDRPSREWLSRDVSTGAPWENHGGIVGQNGGIIGKSWEKMGKPWEKLENHGENWKIMGKSWENVENHGKM